MPFPTDVYDPIEPVSPLSNTVPFSTRSAKSFHFTTLSKYVKVSPLKISN